MAESTPPLPPECRAAPNALPADYSPDALPTIDAIDGRTRAARRYRAIREGIYADMGGGETLSEVQRQMVSKFATMAIQLEVMEATALAGGDIDVDLFGRVSAHMRRLGETIGIERRAKDITPDLKDYMRQREQSDGA